MRTALSTISPIVNCQHTNFKWKPSERLQCVGSSGLMALYCTFFHKSFFFLNSFSPSYRGQYSGVVWPVRALSSHLARQTEISNINVFNRPEIGRTFKMLKNVCDVGKRIKMKLLSRTFHSFYNSIKFTYHTESFCIEICKWCERETGSSPPVRIIWAGGRREVCGKVLDVNMTVDMIWLM